MKVLIIGFGNIGKRHFEGALSSGDCTAIDVIELNSDLISNYPQKGKIRKAYSGISQVSRDGNSYDLVISALRADDFRKNYDTIIELRSGHFLLEKPVGQSAMDVDLISSAFCAINEKVYVNCPRNNWPSYRLIEERIRTSNQTVQCLVSGNNWGLGCSGVHFVEIFRFLTGATSLATESALLRRAQGKHKRGDQYEEFFGQMCIRNSKGDAISINCNEVPGAPVTLSIEFFLGEGNANGFYLNEITNQMIRFDLADVLGGGVRFVSEVTCEFIRNLRRGESKGGIPLLSDHLLAQKCFLEALSRGVGGTHFNIT